MISKQLGEVSRRFAFSLLALSPFVGVAACGDSSQETPATAPEDLRASPATVAAGLKQIDMTATAVARAAGTDTKTAKQLDAQIEPVWMTIEGTVKANDSNAYLTFEDSFASLETAAASGDSTKAQAGATAVSQAVAAYLVKYPG